MLCDDSSTMRRLIKAAIENDPRIKVVAEAKHGQDAIEQLPIASPDIVILDVEMPIMDGIDTTRAIRKISRSLPIVMFSSLTSRGAEATFDAMKAGANDFATKPVAVGHPQDAINQVQRNLIPKIVTLVSPQVFSPTVPTTIQQASRVSPVVAAPQSTANKLFHFTKNIQAIAIGVSTGGPDALEKVLSDIPRGFSLPILITQHMPPVFTKMLAQRLSEKTGHAVVEAQHDQVIEPSTIAVAPGGFHLFVERQGVSVLTKLNEDPPENSCRPAVDPLFRSFASVYGRRSLGVVLTGMGSDGLEGCKALKAVGATVLVQDQESSVVWGMPSKVFGAGLADGVLPLSDVGHTISRSNRTETRIQPLLHAGSN